MGPRFELNSDNSKVEFNDKRWTIMAALLGTNTAIMLFQGIEQETNPLLIREVTLVIIGICLPFQVIYFMIHTYLIEYSEAIGANQHTVLQRLSTLCQVMAYVSLSGITLLWYKMSEIVGLAFTLSALLAIVMIRFAISQAESLEKERVESD